jgi:phage recombination protein Bet
MEKFIFGIEGYKKENEMENEIVKAGADVTADLPAIKITREDITKHFCKLATDTEVAMALAIVKSLKLNPFLHEVHFIKYSQNDKMAIVVGYEVYLKRAERSGRLNGWSAGIDNERKVSWVRIVRKDWQEPFTWEVSLEEFDKKQSTWKQIPSFMAKKVAIAQGFRLCFPEELAGMPYTTEEHEVYDVEGREVSAKPEVQMPKAISAPGTPPQQEVQNRAESPIEAPKATTAMVSDVKTAIPAPIAELISLGRKAFKLQKDFVSFIGSEYGVERLGELTDEQVGKCKAKLEEMIKDEKSNS